MQQRKVMRIVLYITILFAVFYMGKGLISAFSSFHFPKEKAQVESENISEKKEVDHTLQDSAPIFPFFSGISAKEDIEEIRFETIIRQWLEKYKNNEREQNQEPQGVEDDSPAQEGAASPEESISIQDQIADLDEQDYIVIKGRVRENAVEEARYAISQIDPPILALFLSDGGKFIIEDQESLIEDWLSSSDPGDAFLGGMVGYNEIYTRGTNIESSEIHLLAKEMALNISVLHEIGHYVDAKVGYPTKGQAFCNIYNEEAYYSSFSDYAISTPEEYYAESVMAYYTDPQFPSTCPKTFDFVEKDINFLKESI